jgi:epoxyqueuosine reductase
MPDAAPEFAADPRYAALTLEAVARMDVPAFREAFRGTPLARPKRAGMVRNALIAGANLGDDGVRRAAEALVDDEEDAVRATARWALDRFR